MKQFKKEAAVKELNSNPAIVVDMGSFKDLLYNSNAMLNMFLKGAEWFRAIPIDKRRRTASGGKYRCILRCRMERPT